MVHSMCLLPTIPYGVSITVIQTFNTSERNIERAFTSRSLLGFHQPTNLSTTTTNNEVKTVL